MEALEARRRVLRAHAGWVVEAQAADPDPPAARLRRLERERDSLLGDRDRLLAELEAERARGRAAFTDAIAQRDVAIRQRDGLATGVLQPSDVL